MKAKAFEERNNVMTQAAKLKTVIRARAAKTGESYTAARRQVLINRPSVLTAVPEQPAEAKAPPLAVAPPARDPRVPRGELSNKTAIKSTGHDLGYWFKVLDKFGKANGHTKAAEYLYAEHKVQGCMAPRAGSRLSSRTARTFPTRRRWRCGVRPSRRRSTASATSPTAALAQRAQREPEGRAVTRAF